VISIVSAPIPPSTISVACNVPSVNNEELTPYKVSPASVPVKVSVLLVVKVPVYPTLKIDYFAPFLPL